MSEDNDATIARLTDQRNEAALLLQLHMKRAEEAEAKLAEVTVERDEWKDEYKTAEKGLNAYRKANVKVVAERDAAQIEAEFFKGEVKLRNKINKIGGKEAVAQAGFAQGIEAAAKWVKEGYKCQTCGQKFLASDGHEVSECSSVYPSWERIELDELADTIRALSPTPPVDVSETPVRERQAGLTLTDDPQAQPTDNTAPVKPVPTHS